MRRNYFIKVVLVITALLCALGLFACTNKSDGGGGGANINGTYYYYINGTLNKNDYITINGNTWTTKDENVFGTLTVSGESVIFYMDVFGENEEYTRGTCKAGVLTVKAMGEWEYYCMEGKTPPSDNDPPSEDEHKVTVTYNANGGTFSDDKATLSKIVDPNTVLTAPQSPFRKNYYFAGWSTSADGSKLWNFATDIVSSDITLYAVWEQQSAVIFSVDGASIDDNAMSVFLLVEHEIDSVSLSNKVVCSSDSTWKLYYDRLGQTEIPTKIAAGRTGELANGDNVFYIVVTSANGTQVNTYTLTVHRSYLVNINFYDNKEHLIQQDEIYTGYEYNVDYTPSIDGYVFNYWKNTYGNETTKITPYVRVDLYADCTAKKYSVSLNTNGGNEVSKTEYEVTYDKDFTFNVPTRKGYTFLGWYDGNKQVTSSGGRSIADWTYTNNKTLKAKWQANQYLLTLYTNDSNAGTVSGDGNYDYDSNVTISATTKSGYTWLGWYNSNNELVSKDLSYSIKMGFAVSYTAKWTYYTLTTTSNNSSAGTITAKNAVKTTAGQNVTITAMTDNGYTWLGWYSGETELSRNLSYTFTMPSQNITYTAKWIKCPVTLERNITSGGSVSMPDKTVAGESVTITATINNGYTFVGWYNGEIEMTKELNYTFNMPTVNVTYTAKWIKITVDCNDTNAGRISLLNGKYKVGDSVTITATTNSGYTWLGWYNGETELTKELSYTFNMPAVNNTYTAKWTYYTLTTTRNVSNAGTVTAKNSVKTTVGQRVTIAAKTNNGYTWLGWYNDETELSRDLSYTFTMPSQSITYTAKWIKCPVTLERNITSGGSVSIPDKTVVGESVTITATSNLGYTWLGWYNGETELTRDLSYMFEMPTNNVAYMAKWCINDELSNYVFNSTATTLNITGVKDKTVSSLVIPSYVTGISDLAFSDCNNLASIIVADDNTSYSSKDGVLYNKEKTGFVFIPKAIEGSVMVPNTVSIIESNAFSGCSSLTSITIPDGVTSIGEKAFYGCSGLTSITIPNSVTSIGDRAFSCCSSLTSITIPNDVTSIGSSAFNGCKSLTLFCEATTKPSGWNSGWNSSCPVVWNCKQNYKDDYGFEYSVINGFRYELKGRVAIVVGQPTNISGERSIPSSVTYNGETYAVTSIGERAFEDCSSLTSITIPDGVTSIGEKAFYGCTCLTSITVESGNSEYHSAGNCIIKTSTKTLIAGCKNSVIPTDGSVTCIGNYAFSGCISLTSITIPDSVTSIGSEAFHGCTGLTSITIPNSVTSIVWYAFWGCSSLSDITIPDSVTSIGECAFWGCSSLSDITIPNSVTSIGYFAFEDCKRLTIYCEAESKPSGWHSDWNADGRPVVWNCKQNNKDSNGYEYSVIDGVRYRFKNSVATVVRQPTNISGEISIPSSVTYNGETYAVTSIVSYAFEDCRSLTSITIPNSVTSIWGKIFSGCSSLTSITIGNSVTSIGDYAFYDCSSLTSITIPNSVTSIAYSAFNGCRSLTSVYFKGTSGDWTRISIGNNNSALIDATRYYYSETQPTGSGNYWHYDDDGVTPVVW